MNKEEKEEKALRFVLNYYKPGRLDTEKAFRRFLSDRQLKRAGLPLYQKVGRIAAVLALLMMLSAGIYYLYPSEQWVQVAAGASGRECVLPDSSCVTLAPNTTLRYDAKAFARGKGREVELRGKAFFSVRRDTSSVFRVTDGWSEVQVLGTRFLVDATSAGTTLWVESGKVRFAAVRHTAEGLVLTQGMTARLNKGQVRPRMQSQSTLNPMAWKTGWFVYEDEALERVLQELSAYYKVRLTCDTAGKRITGRFSTRSLNEILRIIEQTLKVAVRKENKTQHLQ